MNDQSRLPVVKEITPVRAQDCRALWQSVLAEQWRAAFQPYDSRVGQLLREQAASWFGSRDFHLVCALAGFDGPAVYERFRVKWAGVQ